LAKLDQDRYDQVADAIAEAHLGKTGRGEIRPSVVYLITCWNYMKIGQATDPIKRLYAMQIGCPLDLVLVATVRGNKFTEAKIHRALRSIRHNGEWFRRDPVVIDIFKTIGEVHDLRPAPMKFWHDHLHKETLDQ
jgi:hypothetical protein